MITTFHSILFPTDFSANNETAINYALDLANQFSCKLILFHTYKLSHRAGMFIGVERLMRDEAREQMAELIKQLRTKMTGNAVLEGKVVKGEAVPTIINAAKKLEVDIIVMGTQGASGLKEVFIGSTANGVIKGSKIPVLAVPAQFKYRALKTIALSVDDRLIDQKTSLEILRMIILRYHAKLSAFHIHTKNESIQQNIVEALSKILGEINFDFHEMQAEEKIINEKIQEFVAKEGADLLCMVKRDRGFWGNFFHNSVTTKEAFHSIVPILILHD